MGGEGGLTWRCVESSLYPQHPAVDSQSWHAVALGCPPVQVSAKGLAHEMGVPLADARAALEGYATGKARDKLAVTWCVCGTTGDGKHTVALATGSRAEAVAASLAKVTSRTVYAVALVADAPDGVPVDALASANTAAHKALYRSFDEPGNVLRESRMGGIVAKGVVVRSAKAREARIDAPAFEAEPRRTASVKKVKEVSKKSLASFFGAAGSEPKASKGKASKDKVSKGKASKGKAKPDAETKPEPASGSKRRRLIESESDSDSESEREAEAGEPVAAKTGHKETTPRKLAKNLAGRKASPANSPIKTASPVKRAKSKKAAAAAAATATAAEPVAMDVVETKMETETETKAEAKAKAKAKTSVKVAISAVEGEASGKADDKPAGKAKTKKSGKVSINPNMDLAQMYFAAKTETSTGDDGGKTQGLEPSKASKPNTRRVRKTRMVSKTFTTEEGYLLTEDVEEEYWEEEEIPASEAAPGPAAAVFGGKSKATGNKGKARSGKQASLTSFFGAS